MLLYKQLYMQLSAHFIVAKLRSRLERLDKEQLSH
jgi:hypothetical protein